MAGKGKYKPFETKLEYDRFCNGFYRGFNAGGNEGDAEIALKIDLHTLAEEIDEFRRVGGPRVGLHRVTGKQLRARRELREVVRNSIVKGRQ